MPFGREQLTSAGASFCALHGLLALTAIFALTMILDMTTSIHSRILLPCAFLGLISACALAADDSFIGKWKLNPDKSQFNGLTYKIEDAGGGQYRFVFGDDVETLTLDGKGHVTKYGDTWSIKATGPNSWESTTKRDGK